MPSTVGSLFEACGAEWKACARWGQPLSLTRPGIYVVSGSEDPLDQSPIRGVAPIAVEAVAKLLAVSNVMVDGTPATPESLAARLAGCRLPDENVLYVGKADTSVARRVRQYVRTPLGARRPHNGGWFLKTLSVLDAVWVHAAETDRPEAAERAALECFIAQVSEPTAAALHDPALPLPFANLELEKSRRKGHGIRGATASR